MLRDRTNTEEIMDDLTLGGAEMDQTLRELDFINQTLGGNDISLKAIKKALRNHEAFHLTDLGCGSGEILIRIAKWARTKGKKATFTGIDANPHIVAYARHHCRNYPEISIACVNIFSEEYAPLQTDILHTCLFLHHFDETQLTSLFRLFYKQASTAIIVNDLQRHPIAYWSIKWLTQLFSKSNMVKNDASLSVARGFHKNELTAILQAANIRHFSIRWKWAFRWLLVIRVIH